MKNETVPLSSLKPGDRSMIVRINGNGALRRRCLEMGLVKGETILVERIAPLGDPVAYLVKGTRLSLRQADTRYILVEKSG